MATIEFYYDFSSPNAYLVHKLLPDIAARYGVRMLSGVRFCWVAFSSPPTIRPRWSPFSGIPGKVDYMRVEMARFIERFAVPLCVQPAFSGELFGAHARSGARARYRLGAALY